MSEKLLFESLFVPVAQDYNVSDSCLSVLISPKNSGTYNEGGIPLRNILIGEVDDDIKSQIKIRPSKKGIKFNEIELSSFAISCELTVDDVKGSIYAYLAGKPKDQFKMIYNNNTLDLNTLAWMKYHNVDESMYKMCLSYDQKGTSKERCVICNSWRNVSLMGPYLTTISPDIMSNGRFRQMYSDKDGNCHYVVWHKEHECRDEFNIDLLPVFYIRGTVYEHYDYQYGHKHIHVINGGAMHDIRASELLIKANSKNKKGFRLTFSDFYHPICEFYWNCTNVGQKYIVAAIVLSQLGIYIDGTVNSICRIIHISYPKMVDNIDMILYNV